jgi:hypothetical protein
MIRGSGRRPGCSARSRLRCFRTLGTAAAEFECRSCRREGLARDVVVLHGAAALIKLVPVPIEWLFRRDRPDRRTRCCCEVRVRHDGDVDREYGSSGRRWAAGVFAALAAVAMAVLLSSQLSLMSVLDAERADDAARTVAESRFTGELIEQTVRSAVAPVLDDSTATFVATATSNDQRVREVVRISLVSAHHQVVDPSADDPSGAVTDDSVRNAISDALLAAGAEAGVDVTTVTDRVEAPGVVPDQLPAFGLRPLAETARASAAIVVVVAALLAVAIHPRPGRALAGLGWKFGIVLGAWFVALLVIGWVIGMIAETLFGELLDAVWSDAVPAMLLLCGAGLLLCLALWFGGIALDGLVTRRPRYEPAPAPAPSDPYWS